jgi:hypothetical protein
MTGTGNPYRPDGGGYREHVERLRDYSLDDIVINISCELAVTADYEQHQDLRMHNTPTNWWIHDKAKEMPKAVLTLTHNTAVYNDDLEDTLCKDGLLGELIEQRKNDTNNQQLQEAIRIRRTVLVRILLEDLAEVLDASNNDTPPAMAT